MLGRVLNYLLVPLYTAVFLPGEYGVVTELYAYMAFLNVIYVYGLESAYFRFSKEGPQYFHVAFTSIFFSSLLFSGVLWIGAAPLASYLGYTEKAYIIRWLAAILAIDAIVAIPFARLRQEGKAIRFAIYKLLNIGLNIGLNLFFILLCPYLVASDAVPFLTAHYDAQLGVGYVFLSNLMANAAYLLLFIPTWMKTKLRFSGKVWKQMMHYAWPILIIGFAGVINEMLSRALLKHRLPVGFYEGASNQEILGIFGACYKLAIFMTIVIQAFRYAFEPFIFARSTDKNSPETFSRVMTYFVIFGSFCWLTLSLFLPYYAPLLLRQERYLAALDVVPWLLGGGLLMGIFYNLSLWYKLTDQTHFGAIISATGAAVTFALNWLLIPRYGYMGSGYATVCSTSTMVVFSYLMGRRHYPVPYERMKLMGLISLAAAGILVNQMAGPSLLIGVAIVVIFLTLVILSEKRNFIFKKA